MEILFSGSQDSFLFQNQKQNRIKYLQHLKDANLLTRVISNISFSGELLKDLIRMCLRMNV